MCGIAAVIHRDPNVRLPTLNAVLGRIEHRGQSNHRYEVLALDKEHTSLGTHRLAIVAEDESKQPIIGPLGRIVIVFQGELYNHSALRQQLEGSINFNRTCSDTEVVAAALEYWGPNAALPLFDWEGAFVAVDIESRRLIAGRDPLGIKPLYSAHLYGGGIALASEIKALVPLRTMGEVEPIDSGTYVVARLENVSTLRSTKYWSPSTVSRGPEKLPTAPDVAAELLERLRRSVHARVPDFPYAVALSGGIDSAAVLTLAREKSDCVTAYTVNAPGSEDIAHARDLCRQLDIPLVSVEARSESELLQDVPRTVYDLETWEWHVLTHALAMRPLAERIARDGHKVVLSGEGSDEIFAGYPAWGRPIDRLKERLRRLRELPRTNCRRLDRLGMAHTLEFRVPFLNVDVVTLALSLGPAFLEREGQGKWILREAVQGLLPPSIVQRPKLSFARGVGYKYGPHDRGRGLLSDVARSTEDATLPPEWKGLARFPAEEYFLEIFCRHEYSKAPYLRARTI